MNVRR